MTGNTIDTRCGSPVATTRRPQSHWQKWRRARGLPIPQPVCWSRQHQAPSGHPAGDSGQESSPIAAVLQERVEPLLVGWIVFGGGRVRAASGQTAATPATALMKSRRRIAPPRLRIRHRSGSNWQTGSGQNGAQQCPLWVKSRHGALKTRCPLYPPEADIPQSRLDVRFVPKAD